MLRLLVILGLFICSCKESAKQFTQPSDVMILLEYDVALVKKQQPYCGGTVVKSDAETSTTQILTAAHCILDDDDKPVKYTFIKYGERVHRVEVIRLKREADVALLQVTDPIEQLLSATIAISTPLPGDPLWIVGSGAGVEDILSHGTMSKPNVVSRWSDVKVDIIDGSIFYGNSGGGVFNQNMELIGVLIEVGPQGPMGTGLWGYSVTLTEIIDIMNPGLPYWPPIFVPVIH